MTPDLTTADLDKWPAFIGIASSLQGHICFLCDAVIGDVPAHLIKRHEYKLISPAQARQVATLKEKINQLQVHTSYVGTPITESDYFDCTCATCLLIVQLQEEVN